MPLCFQDWSASGLFTRGEMIEKYQRKGFTFPEKGRYLIKVFPVDRRGLVELEEWARQRNLPVHHPKNGHFRRTHVDLYGPNLAYAPEKEVLPPDRVKSLIKEGFFSEVEGPNRLRQERSQ